MIFIAYINIISSMTLQQRPARPTNDDDDDDGDGDDDDDDDGD